MSEEKSKIFGFIDKISEFALGFEKIPNYLPEIIALILFAVLFFFFGYFHEPWFDEAQAWQIARCATYHDILFYLPHFEGHPPLWHLILSVFAKNGFPYEITLLGVSFVFSYVTAFLIIFKSPFLRIVKILLPFSYFLFYQNGIISRPYCMVMFAFCLLAIFYEKRYEKPYFYTLSLVFLSMTHLYSFVLSCFLALIWFIEGVKNKSFKSLNFILSCIILGVCYLAVLFIIFPYPEAVALNSGSNNSILNKIIYVTLILPSDCFISYVCDILQAQKFEFYDMLFASITGIFIWYFLYIKTKNKGFLFLNLIVPYFFFALIASKYFYLQHLGIIFPFFIFIFWLAQKIKTEYEPNKNIEKAFILFVAISLCVNLYWSFKSCIVDMLIRYNPGKKEAEFIYEHNLDKYNILADIIDTGWVKKDKKNKVNLGINCGGPAIVLAPYFEKNIFYNFKRNYALHKMADKKEVENFYSQWAKYGYPDVIVGNASYKLPLLNIKNEEKKEYIYVFSDNFYYINKGKALNEQLSNIMVEKNLAKKLNLKEVKPEYSSKYYDLGHLSEKIATKIILKKEERK